MRARLIDDPGEFLAATEPLLAVDEARHNLMLGIAATVRDHPDRYLEHRFWLVEGEGGEPVAAALRTPPYNLVVARPRIEPALELLAATITDDLPGVSGAMPEVQLFAAAWEAKTGRSARERMRQGIYRLDRLQAAPMASGRAREASAGDRGLLLGWWHAFLVEASHGELATAVEVAAAVDHRLGAAGSGILIWEAEDGPVTMAAYGDGTPNGIRVGPVYTPPALRGRGYATALVAELSARLLHGRRFCFLYTNLENATANRIYQRLGYERVCDAAIVAFD